MTGRGVAFQEPEGTEARGNPWGCRPGPQRGTHGSRHVTLARGTQSQAAAPLRRPPEEAIIFGS